MRSTVGRGTAGRDLHALLAGAVLLLGMLVSIPLARSRVPLYPGDLAVYIGAYYASEDGESPYDIDALDSSLRARGIEIEAVADYVYPPPFLLPFRLLGLMPYRYFRMLWIGASILAAWGGSWLLSLRLRGRRRLAFAVLSALFLLVSGVMHDCLYWGQVSCFLFAAICVLACRRFRGVLAGASSALLLLAKVGFAPFVAFIRGGRAWIALAALVVLLFLLGGAELGFGSYPAWIGKIEEIGDTWKSDLSNNLGLLSLTSRAVESVSVSDEQRDMALRNPELRFGMAQDLSRRTRIVNASLLAVLLGGLSLRLLLMVRSGQRPQREYLLSLACLLLVVALPFVWLHYGLVLLVPLWYLLAVGRGRAALLLWVSIMLYGLPLSSSVGVWTSLPGLRSLVPLGWLAYLAWRPAGATSVGMDAQPEVSPV